MLQPFISIGITAYNEGKWLKEAWASVINQTDNRWEAIIVLDGKASKKTVKIFNQIDHPQLLKIKLDENIGPYQARTISIQNASTAWYYQLDGDDILPTNAVELIINTIEQNPKLDFVYGNAQHFRKKTEKILIGSWDLDNLSMYPTIDCHSPFRIELFEKILSRPTTLSRSARSSASTTCFLSPESANVIPAPLRSEINARIFSSPVASIRLIPWPITSIALA